MRTTKKTKAITMGLVAVASGLSVWAVCSRYVATSHHGLSPQAQARLDKSLAVARAATAKYVTDLTLAKRNGYGIITKMIPNMGYHYMNVNVKGFDVRKPPILVYEHRGASWQLGAIEWVFPSKPAAAPLPGARYGSFGAGCHYTDGTFVPSGRGRVPGEGPGVRREATFWHPRPDDARLALVPESERLFAICPRVAAPFSGASDWCTGSTPRLGSPGPGRRSSEGGSRGGSGTGASGSSSVATGRGGVLPGSVERWPRRSPVETNRGTSRAPARGLGRSR
jgi:hypothetical protein